MVSCDEEHDHKQPKPSSKPGSKPKLKLCPYKFFEENVFDKGGNWYCLVGDKVADNLKSESSCKYYKGNWQKTPRLSAGTLGRTFKPEASSIQNPFTITSTRDAVLPSPRRPPNQPPNRNPRPSAHLLATTRPVTTGSRKCRYAFSLSTICFCQVLFGCFCCFVTFNLCFACLVVCVKKSHYGRDELKCLH